MNYRKYLFSFLLFLCVFRGDTQMIRKLCEEEKKTEYLKDKLKSLNEDQINFLKEKFDNPRNLYKAIFDHIWNMKSYITIFQLQDLLKLDDRARINFPGTVGNHNWSYKLKSLSWMSDVKFGQ